MDDTLFASGDAAVLADSVDRFLADHYRFEQRRQRLAATGDGLGCWPAMAELGWLGLPFAEALGGFGGSWSDVALLMQRFGRALVVEPYVANVALAGGLLARLGTAEQHARWLRPMIDGRCRLALAYGERAARHQWQRVRTVVEARDDGDVVHGRKTLVWGGAQADVLLVLAREGNADGALSLCLVEPHARGVHAAAITTVDGRAACELTLDAAPVAARLGAPGAIADEVERVLDIAAALACAEGIGVLEVLFDSTLEYLKQRQQFGRPLASNQALQHRLVDMHTLLREAAGMARHAVHALDGDAVLRRHAVATAKAFVGDALRHIGQEAVQLHGAIGTTDEFPLSHGFKRATALSLMFGDADHHRARLATLLQRDHASVESASATLLTDEGDRRFANEVRAFIAAHLPRAVAHKVAHDQHLSREDVQAWQSPLAAKGWLAYTWPLEHGGPGWTPRQQFIFEALSSEADCPPINPLGLRMVGKVLQRFGTPEQQARFLPPIRESRVWWCQGYSEPNAGSDLASLATRAERRGDRYVVNGQKIWTSYAHWADWMFCLVRTSRESKAQHGISFLLIDMTSPGIEVRPIPQLDGTHNFNQVFFTDVEVPAHQLVGEEGQGWTCAKYLLSHERLETAALPACQRTMRRLLQVAFAPIDGGPAPADDPAFLTQLVDAGVRLRALQLRVLAFLEQQDQGQALGPEVSELKVRGTELYQRLLELIMLAAGPDALPYHQPFVLGRAEQPLFGPAFAATSATRYFKWRSMSILGGSNEIQRNVVAKAVLDIR
jgi:alkylation response protein AidB-like acyl-CoA dehydrogenase